VPLSVIFVSFIGKFYRRFADFAGYMGASGFAMDPTAFMRNARMPNQAAYMAGLRGFPGFMGNQSGKGPIGFLEAALTFGYPERRKNNEFHREQSSGIFCEFVDSNFSGRFLFEFDLLNLLFFLFVFEKKIF
jgi:hypothetical protein